ncbi:dbp [Adoxophyes orana nucleopolyhedrovirus]|uniref:dbp n=1 Tax=Adoxophyes orana nucleopolyhedrovirus TaxID=542343 RepID=UPI0001829BEC|nr:dbp [Adoxophyes orana nucleopolyhedrovirus]ACF05319.1 dbp [Adoxophyes orana nucleopolyhedrovirus]
MSTIIKKKRLSADHQENVAEQSTKQVTEPVIEEATLERPELALDLYQENITYDPNDALIRWFNTQPEDHNITWAEKMIYNLSKGKNSSVVNCLTSFHQNQLKMSLDFVNTTYNFAQYENQLYPEPISKITVEAPKAPKLTYNVGYHVKGGAVPFYFFDTVILKRFKSTFGEFLTIKWSNINKHNKVYSNIMLKYFSEEMCRLQESCVINLPDDSNLAKIPFVRKFYDIRKCMNQTVYSTGDLIKSVVCEPFGVERFNNLFEFEYDGNEVRPSKEVEMYMGAIIEGFRQSKNEKQLENLNNKKIQEKTYSLAIKPMIFFYIEQ